MSYHSFLRCGTGVLVVASLALGCAPQEEAAPVVKPTQAFLEGNCADSTMAIAAIDTTKHVEPLDSFSVRYRITNSGSVACLVSLVDFVVPKGTHLTTASPFTSPSGSFSINAGASDTVTGYYAAGDVEGSSPRAGMWLGDGTPSTTILVVIATLP